jgi:predicted dehydrogenase
MITRRQFLSRTALVTGAVSALSPRSLARASGANNTVRLAVVGVRGKGAHHIQIFSGLPDVQIAALCDADRQVLNAQLRNLEKKHIKAEGYTDVRRILERNDIDALVTATPNHWHSLLTVWTCQAGKDMYVEKPVSHNVWEGRKAVEAARKYRRIVQSGTQSRADPALQEAFDYLREGNLGAIRLARGFCYKRRGTIGKVRGPQPLPAGVDFDLWTGPAPLEPLRRQNFHYDWHWVWSTGNGDIGNQGVHEMDMCRWAIGQNTLPGAVLSVGGRFGYDDDGETPNTQIAFYDYQPVPILFEVRGLPRRQGEEGEAMDIYKGARVGIVIECENGYFTGGGGGGWACAPDGTRIKQFKGPGGRDHQENFLKAVRSRRVADLTADIEQGHWSSALCHLGNISYRLGQITPSAEIQERLKGHADALESFDRMLAHLDVNGVEVAAHQPVLGPRLSLDPQSERFVGEWSDYANMLARPAYREPFIIRDAI